jgi:hypothetical protein
MFLVRTRGLLCQARPPTQQATRSSQETCLAVFEVWESFRKFQPTGGCGTFVRVLAPEPTVDFLNKQLPVRHITAKFLAKDSNLLGGAAAVPERGWWHGDLSQLSENRNRCHVLESFHREGWRLLSHTTATSDRQWIIHSYNFLKE